MARSEPNMQGKSIISGYIQGKENRKHELMRQEDFKLISYGSYTTEHIKNKSSVVLYTGRDEESWLQT